MDAAGKRRGTLVPELQEKRLTSSTKSETYQPISTSLPRAPDMECMN